MDSSGSGWGIVAGTCKHGNDLFGSISFGESSWLADNVSASQEQLRSM